MSFIFMSSEACTLLNSVANETIPLGREWELLRGSASSSGQNLRALEHGVGTMAIFSLSDTPGSVLHCVCVCWRDTQIFWAWLSQHGTNAYEPDQGDLGSCSLRSTIPKAAGWASIPQTGWAEQEHLRCGATLTWDLVSATSNCRQDEKSKALPLPGRRPFD